MRLICVLPTLSLLLGASASSLDYRHPDAHPLDARDVSDVCAFVNAELIVLSEYNAPTDVGGLGQFNDPLLNLFQPSLL
jgi:hypothetical protein